MDPSVTPPWRVLETPSDADPAGTNAPAERTSATRSWANPGVVRAVAVVALAIVLALVAFALAVTSGSGDGVVVDVEPVGSTASGPAGMSAGGAQEVVVEVLGAVVHPGVFRLPAGSRVADLLTAAGGYGPRVDTDRAAADLHLAAVLADGDRVRVPSRDDLAVELGPAEPASSGTPTGSPIDLNRATLEELDTLPGIGPVTAQKIVAAREEAPFGAVDELRSRGVLGEKTFERIRDLVTAG
jgi:competence protein ComEA